MDFSRPRALFPYRAQFVPRPDRFSVIGLVGSHRLDRESLEHAGAFSDENGWSIDLRSPSLDIHSLAPVLPRMARESVIPMVVDLIPSSSWFASLANMLTASSWSSLRTAVIGRDESCIECGSRRRLEVHELWRYDDMRGVQRLIDLELLCKLCHETRHLGLARLRGRFQIAMDRLAIINRLLDSERSGYMDIVSERFERRSRQDWSLDLSGLSAWRLSLKESVVASEDGWLSTPSASCQVIGLVPIERKRGWDLIRSNA